MHRTLGLLCLMCTLSAAADPLTIERIFADPALAGPTPRGVKIAPDGSRVGLLRGRADDQHQLDLWTYDLKTRSPAGPCVQRPVSARASPTSTALWTMCGHRMAGACCSR